MDVLELEGCHTEEATKAQEAYTGHDYDSRNTCTERIDQHHYRKQEKKHSTEYGDSAAFHLEVLHVASERKHHEAMIHHPDAEHCRKQHQGDIRIDAEENTKEKIQDTSYDPISFHCKVIAACGCHDQLSRTDKKNDDSKDDAQSNITLNRKDKDCNACKYTKQACNPQKPPVLNDATGPSDQMFKMTFHNTMFN